MSCANAFKMNERFSGIDFSFHLHNTSAASFPRLPFPQTIASQLEDNGSGKGLRDKGSGGPVGYV